MAILVCPELGLTSHFRSLGSLAQIKISCQVLLNKFGLVIFLIQTCCTVHSPDDSLCKNVMLSKVCVCVCKVPESKSGASQSLSDVTLLMKTM